MAELGQKCLEAGQMLKFEPLNSCITVLDVSIIKIFICYTLAVIKEKYREEPTWRLRVLLFDLSNVMFRCQNLMGF